MAGKHLVGRYEYVRRYKNAPALLAKVTPLGQDRVKAPGVAHPGLPLAYLDLLRELGYGNYGGVYSIYSGLSSPEDVYGKTVPDQLRPLLLFGDDFQGYCAAFDPLNGYSMVEIDPTTLEADPIDESFEKFARATFLWDETSC